MVTLMVYNENGSRDIMVFTYMLQARIFMLKEHERVSAVHKNVKLGEDYLSYGNGAGLILRENSFKLSLSCNPKDYADKDSGLIRSGAYSLVRTPVLAKCVEEWNRIMFIIRESKTQNIDENNIDTVLRNNYKTIANIFSRAIV